MSNNAPLIGADQMANSSPPSMSDLIAQEDAKWRRLAADAEERAKQAKEVADRGSSGPEAAEAHDIEPPQPIGPSIAELVRRLAAEQLINLKRSPGLWLPQTVTFTGVPVQIVGPRPFRKSIGFAFGSAAVTLGVSLEDVTEANARTISLPSSQSLTMDTEGPVWGTAASGTTLVVIETIWSMQAYGAAVADIAQAIQNGVVLEEV